MSNALPSPLLGPQAPFSQEAEEAVIGAVLINPDILPLLASFLSKDDFFLKRHEYIWEALLRISNASADDGELVFNYVTLEDDLRAMGKLANIGGAGYLLNLVNNTPSSVNAEVYGRLVQRAASRRRLMSNL